MLNRKTLYRLSSRWLKVPAIRILLDATLFALARLVFRFLERIAPGMLHYGYARARVRKELEEPTSRRVLPPVPDSGPALVVSLTSFPPRMAELPYTLYSLLHQQRMPDAVVLWLSTEEFPHGLDSVPSEVARFTRSGLEIGFCENIRSYKKLIPTLARYPEATIVTADDDIFYHPDWLEQLTDAHERLPHCVHCHRGHRITFAPDGSVAAYGQWISGSEAKGMEPSFLNFATGSRGILYPVGALDDRVMDADRFMALAPRGDDIWFWAMAVLKGTRITILDSAGNTATQIQSLEQRAVRHRDSALCEQNVLQGYNDIQVRQVLAQFPEIMDSIGAAGGPES